MIQPTTPAMNPIDAFSVFAELGRVVLGDEPLGAVLERVAGLAAKAIPEASEVSVTLMEGGRAHTVAFTGSLAVQLDERQYETGWGPCLDAAVSGHTITVPRPTRHPRPTPTSPPPPTGPVSCRASRSACPSPSGWSARSTSTAGPKP